MSIYVNNMSAIRGKRCCFTYLCWDEPQNVYLAASGRSGSGLGILCLFKVATEIEVVPANDAVGVIA